jgi:hypothetical protein
MPPEPMPRSPWGWCVPPTFSRTPANSRDRARSSGCRQGHVRSLIWQTDATGSSPTPDRYEPAGCPTAPRTFPRLPISARGTRCGERHGRPRRGRQAGLRPGHRDPLRSSGRTLLIIYPLPLSPTEALLESASFCPVAVREDQTALLRYPRTRHPDVGFTVTQAESFSIPLGFAPQNRGPRACSARHETRPDQIQC